MFSATTTKKTEDLVKVALKKQLIYIRIEGYVICPSETRFLLLITFLKKSRNKKVKFHHELHRPVRDVHPRQAEADQADHHLLPVL